MSGKIAEGVMVRGKVNIGDGAQIQPSVILGSSDNGELSIGRDCVIRSGAVIYSAVKIGDRFRSGHNTLIRDNTVIGDSVLVGTGAVVDGDCIIGNRVSIQTGVYITKDTTIEDGVFMGPLSVTTNDKYMKYGAELRGPIIKQGARVGANATILPGVVVGRNSVVGSGAVVTRDVADNDVVAGNPARSIRRSNGA